MRQRLHNLVLAVAAVVLVAPAVSRAAITATPNPFEPLNQNYNQNFNSLGRDSLGTSTGPVYSLDPGPGATQGLWSSGAQTTPGQPDYYATNGSIVTGAVVIAGTPVPDSGVYSVGTRNVIGIDSTDRAFGTLTNNGSQQVVAAVFQANAAIAGMRVSYFGEQWGKGGSGITDTLHFEYTIIQTVMDANITGDAPNLGGVWLDETDGAITMVTGATPDFSTLNNTAGAAALNGNLVANRSARVFDIDVLLDPGDIFVLRWVDLDVTGGRDDLLAIDDLNVTVTVVVVPEPATASLALMSLFGLVIRRPRVSRGRLR